MGKDQVLVVNSLSRVTGGVLLDGLQDCPSRTFCTYTTRRGVRPWSIKSHGTCNDHSGGGEGNTDPLGSLYLEL